MSLSVTARWGEQAAREIGLGQWIGIAALTAERLRAALAVGDDLDAITKVFQLHPCFRPREYVDFRVERPREDAVRLSVADCPALEELDHHTWFTSLGGGSHAALSAIAGTINARAQCRPVSPADGARYAWDVTLDPRAAWKPGDEVALAKLSTGATFVFERRRLARPD